MATDNGDSHGKRVLDEEGDVDQQVKDRIITARNRVDDREDYLFIEAPVDNAKTVSDREQVLYWGMVVKQYLRAIEPLLRSDDVINSAHYYDAVELGSVELVPEDTNEYPFGKVARNGMSALQFKIQYGIPQSESLPEPVTKDFVGLKSIIGSDGVVSHTWTVRVGGFDRGGAGESVTVTSQRLVPKWLYETAIRTADEFLQEVGVGIDIGTPEIDVVSEPF